MGPLSMVARGAIVLALSLCANISQVNAEPANEEKVLAVAKDRASTALYKLDETIPVECLNRTV